jgi:signal transduction histidine kinase
VTLSIEGTKKPLPATVERTAYRVVQEGLTNVVKHAGFPETTVLLRHSPGGLEVRVRNGTPTSHADKLPRGAGLGLLGLRERVELMDGTFEAGPAGDGYAVRVFLPVIGGIADDPGPDR